MNRHRAARALVVSVFLLLLAAACSSSSPKAQSPSPSPPRGAATITIRNFQFTGDLTVKAGARVTVRNADTTAHTLTSVSGTFNTGQIAGGSSKTFVAPKPGKYPFHCDIHNYMQATLTVTS